MKKTIVQALFGIIAVATSSAAMGALIFTGSSGSLSASASFSTLTGSGCSTALCLQILLANTGAPASVPADGLTALFFNITGNPLLSSDSAVLANGSTILDASTTNYPLTGGLNPVDGVGVVGGEFGYLNGLNQYSANEGISSSGFNIFGQPTFPGSNLQDPTALDGIEYALVHGLAANANKGLTGQGLISNSVLFTLDSLPANFNLASITNVTFQYGTALNEGHITAGPPTSGDVPPSVPEPESLALITIGMLALAWARKNRPI